jgi:hypothetical protein
MPRDLDEPTRLQLLQDAQARRDSLQTMDLPL